MPKIVMSSVFAALLLLSILFPIPKNAYAHEPGSWCEKVTDVTIGIYGTWEGALIPMFYAQKAGYFADECMRVTHKVFKDMQAVVLGTGKVDMINGIVEILPNEKNRSFVDNFLIVRLFTEKPTYFLSARPELGIDPAWPLKKKLNALAGKKIAVNQCNPLGSDSVSTNSSAAQYIRYMLGKERTGLTGFCGSSKTYTDAGKPYGEEQNVVFLVPTGGSTARIAATRNGLTDAGLVSSPKHLTVEGLPVVIRYDELPAIPDSALVVRKDWFDDWNNKAIVYRFHRALKRAIRSFRENSHTAKELEGFLVSQGGFTPSAKQLERFHRESLDSWSESGKANGEKLELFLKLHIPGIKIPVRFYDFSATD